MSSMKLRVPQHVYERRLQRMSYLIGAKAPAIIIYHEARLIQKAYQPSLWNRIMFVIAGTWVGFIFDWEWIKFQLTGKSDLYGFDPEESLTESELKEIDLADPNFLLSLSPEQLQRSIKDIADNQQHCTCLTHCDGIDPMHGFHDPECPLFHV